ncbi:MAG: glycine betaine/L-proline ABC transporter ATP-binding protein [Rhodovibrionaceae bacterium]
MSEPITVKGLYKVFGPNPEESIRLAEEGFAKDDIYDRSKGVVAVNDVSFEIQPETVFVVMGLSGSGKSTLVRCFNRLIEPTQGEIHIGDKNVTAMDEQALRRLRLEKMSMVFQHFALFPHKTVCENAEYGLKVQGVAREERRSRAIDALEAVGLKAWADAYPKQLSGGMQQRVGLARGLAVDPEILLMDEPFSALDPLIRRDMQDELLELQKRFKTTIVFITHDLHEALRLGDQVAIMKDGRFVQLGGPEEIVSQPADDYVRSFTRDVDRSRVLTLGALSGEACTLEEEDAGLTQARDRLAESGKAGLYLVDREGRPCALLLAEELARAEDGAGLKDLRRDAFPRGGQKDPLFDHFHSLGGGLPLAVIDSEGRLVGDIDPAEALARLQAAGNEREAA